MFSIRTVIAAPLVAALIAPTIVSAGESRDDRAIRQTLARYEAALNASDTAHIVDLYTKTGIQMAPEAPAAVGLEAVKIAYDGTFKAISLNLKFTVDEIKVLSKNTALLRSHSDGMLKINGTEQPAGPAAFKELFVLSKQADGQWKFSHYSFSTAPVSKQ